MSKSGSGGTEEVVTFEDLPENTPPKEPSRLTKLKAFLEQKLKPEEATEAFKILGLEEKDLTNRQLLEEIEKLLGKKKDEYEYPGKEKKGAETELASYKEYMKKCMEGGKSMADCAKEWKQKYPGPSKEEEADMAKLSEEIELARKKKKDEYEYPEAVKKKMEELQAEVKVLKEAKENMEISSAVDKQIAEKHLAPSQRDAVIKLMASVTPEKRGEILDLFKGVRFKVMEDVGQTANEKPGAEKPLTPEEKKDLAHKHGLDELMKEKGGKLGGIS